MKLYKDVLSPNTLAIVNQEFNSFIDTPEKWTSSIFKWKPNIKVNVSGSTMITMASDGVSKLVIDNLIDLIPSTNVTVQYCVWPAYSGISSHSDSHVSFGATIYLNESWDINDGGIFMYQYEGSEWRAHMPTFNTMMVNDSSTLHLVTPVSPFAKHNRYTIQIFGDLRNE